MAIGRNRPQLKDDLPPSIDHLDELLDEALRETFPASDPIAVGTPQGDCHGTYRKQPGGIDDLQR